MTGSFGSFWLRSGRVLAAGLAAVVGLMPACTSGSPAPTRQPVDRTARGAARAAPEGTADLVLVGGVIVTMDPERPRVSAIAVRGERVVATGDDPEIRALIDERTRVIELGGRAVTPGLVDGHCHLYGLGSALESVSLRDAASAVDAARAVAEAASSRAAGEWIVGRGWDHTLWTPAEFPHHSVLDTAVADHPVAVRRIGGHALWANRAAMERAQITRATRSPPGGQIVRDRAGNPTGVFIDAAMGLIEAHIPAPTAAVRERRIGTAAAVAVRHGLTGVHEMGLDDATVAAYRALADRGELPLRVTGYMAAGDDIAEVLASRKPQADRGADHFSLRGAKLYADGALGSRGAALLAPYADARRETGNHLLNTGELTRIAEVAARNGWQLATHAIGDAANRAVLDAYAAAIRNHPDADLRFRVEHAQVVMLADLPRFGQLGVLASMQPTHATSDMRWAEARLGPERIRGAYAWRSILDGGGRIVAGSDFPVEEVAPLLGIHAAVTRTDAAGNPPGGWYPGQLLTLAEALEAFTVQPAYAAFVEDHRGRLRAGYVADMTVYDRALTADRSLLDTRIDLTVVGGRVVFDRTSGPRGG